MAQTSGVEPSLLVGIVHTAAKELGFDKVKDKQEEMIVNLTGNDVFVVQLTEYSKSPCYICLPKAFDLMRNAKGSIVMVITPLTAIIKDQVVPYVVFFNGSKFREFHKIHGNSQKLVAQNYHC